MRRRRLLLFSIGPGLTLVALSSRPIHYIPSGAQAAQIKTSVQLTSGSEVNKGRARSEA
jgi:hypothetical protein